MVTLDNRDVRLLVSLIQTAVQSSYNEGRGLAGDEDTRSALANIAAILGVEAYDIIEKGD